MSFHNVHNIPKLLQRSFAFVMSNIIEIVGEKDDLFKATKASLNQAVIANKNFNPYKNASDLGRELQIEMATTRHEQSKRVIKAELIRVLNRMFLSASSTEMGVNDWIGKSLTDIINDIVAASKDKAINEGCSAAEIALIRPGLVFDRFMDLVSREWHIMRKTGILDAGNSNAR